MNTLKTTLLLSALTALFMALGFTIGGTGGALIALLLAAGMNLFTYWNADKLVLRMHGAREVGPEHELHRITRELIERAQMPMPKVYVIDTDHPNAFATGRNPENAAVAATAGLMRMLDRREIAGVMAHELAHVRNRDTLIMTMVATIAGAISMVANFALFFRSGERGNMLATLAAVIVAPFAAMIVQMAISRHREYGADRGGAEISGDPQALASALAKIAGGAERVPNPVVDRNPAAAQLYIVPALKGGRDGLFSTHPDTGNRIAALHAMAGDFGAPPVMPAVAARPVATPRVSALGTVARRPEPPRAARRGGSALDPLRRD